ncbi:unnamed protein product [Caenorhabditis auriculariae]|uniref:BHLH domain-containing protein n=1 Tax=Caenorhabditis auriculariae TaxID=2777116 RepID=A0A8S1HMA0_9PELO|nr:unnamed protein product [Caenorhabditis auriculariae]
MSQKEPSRKGESLAKRNSRSVHEKKRRCELNDILAEMMSLVPSNLLTTTSRNDKRPDKCNIIGAAVDIIKKDFSQPASSRNSRLLKETMSLIEPCIFLVHNWRIEQAFGSAFRLFRRKTFSLIGKDIRSILSMESSAFLMAENILGWSLNGHQQLKTAAGATFDCFSKKHETDDEIAWLLVCLPSCPISEEKKMATSPLELDRPLLAALLRKKSPEPQKEASNNQVFSCCDTPSSSFASTPSTGSRKRLNKEEDLKAFSSHKPFKSANSCIFFNALSSLSPAYKEIWLRLQSERLLLEERVLEKERELQGLMLSALRNPPSTSFIPPPDHQLLLHPRTFSLPSYSSQLASSSHIYQQCHLLSSINCTGSFNIPPGIVNSMLTGLDSDRIDVNMNSPDPRASTDSPEEISP